MGVTKWLYVPIGKQAETRSDTRKTRKVGLRSRGLKLRLYEGGRKVRNGPVLGINKGMMGLCGVPREFVGFGVCSKANGEQWGQA